jgi:hypothetical protein
MKGPTLSGTALLCHKVSSTMKDSGVAFILEVLENRWRGSKAPGPQTQGTVCPEQPERQTAFCLCVAGHYLT